VVGFDVRAALATAVERRLPSGAVLDPDQRLSVAQAVRMYTRGAADALGMHGQIGQLSPGARADAVVTSDALEDVPPSRLADVAIRATYAGRRALHQD
jgi:predicted amidohydrolase YtcJ